MEFSVTEQPGSAGESLNVNSGAAPVPSRSAALQSYLRSPGAKPNVTDTKKLRPGIKVGLSLPLICVV